MSIFLNNFYLIKSLNNNINLNIGFKILNCEDKLFWYKGNEHHWTIPCAFKKLQEICKNENIILKTNNIELHKEIIASHCFETLRVISNDNFEYIDLEGNHFNGNSSILYGTDIPLHGFTNGLSGYSKYHSQYIGTHLVSSVYNHSCKNGIKILIIGDSMIAPMIPILANNSEKVTLIDNRNNYDLSSINKKEYNKFFIVSINTESDIINKFKWIT
jgi:hypothetical protein